MSIAYFLPENFFQVVHESDLITIDTNIITNYIKIYFESPKTLKLKESIFGCKYYVYEGKNKMSHYNDLAMRILDDNISEEYILGNVILHNDDKIFVK